MISATLSSWLIELSGWRFSTEIKRLIAWRQRSIASKSTLRGQLAGLELRKRVGDPFVGVVEVS